MKLKLLHFADVAEIQEAVTDELKKVQKEEFRQVFRNCGRHKSMCMCVCVYIYIYIYAIWGYIELKKKVCVFLMCLLFFFKKISPKTFGPHCGIKVQVLVVGIL